MEAANVRPIQSIVELGGLVAAAFDAASLRSTDPEQVAHLACALMDLQLQGARWTTERNRQAVALRDHARRGVGTSVDGDRPVQPVVGAEVISLSPQPASAARPTRVSLAAPPAVPARVRAASTW